MATPRSYTSGGVLIKHSTLWLLSITHSVEPAKFETSIEQCSLNDVAAYFPIILGNRPMSLLNINPKVCPSDELFIILVLRLIVSKVCKAPLPSGRLMKVPALLFFNVCFWLARSGKDRELKVITMGISTIVVSFSLKYRLRVEERQAKKMSLIVYPEKLLLISLVSERGHLDHAKHLSALSAGFST
ncbi:hypothetical protein RF11_11189 [Thelohanellus kitauei]|uniref:Uncharacterized protein n=1 Tax=Thelohanellus kitauei TaxID=669202 RepID=A0A0C2MJ50_THEKT|nr:hypothetical protein RF11_11189 [Thelohanellus kitauei]